MGARPYYKRYPSDFITGCIKLSLEEKGAYSMVIDMIFDEGGAIENDPQWIARVCSCSVRKWKALFAVLVAKGKLYINEAGRISSLTAEKHLEKEVKEAREFAENGAKGGQKSAENRRKSREINDLAQKGPSEIFDEKPSIPIPIPIPIKDHALHALHEVVSNSDADQEPDNTLTTVTHIRDRMPRLTDPPSVWMKLMPHLPWSIANPAGVKEPMVGADENWVLLIPACQAICAAALIHDPDWRGDWNTVEQWVREGLSVGCHVIPAIEEQVRNFGERYRQPHRLSGFTGVIRKYAARLRAAA